MLKSLTNGAIGRRFSPMETWLDPSVRNIIIGLSFSRALQEFSAGDFPARHHAAHQEIYRSNRPERRPFHREESVRGRAIRCVVTGQIRKFRDATERSSP